MSGIRTIEDIRERCTVDELTDCWHWSGAVAHASGKTNVVPVAWYPPLGRIWSVLRIAYTLHRGVELRHNRLVWRKCGASRCCNPEHLAAGTRAQWGNWIKATSHWQGQGAHRRAANRRGRMNGGAKLTPELASWIVESEQLGYEIAHALDVSPTAVSRVRLGRTWASLSSPTSVFNLCGGGR